MSISRARLQFKRGRIMRTSLLCIQCKDRSLEHVRDSWISRYVLTLSIIFQNLHLVAYMFYWLGTMERTSKDSTSTPPRIPESHFTKIDALATYGVVFGRSIYGWNQNFIELPMALVPTSKFLLSRQESSKQMVIQNLSGCCVTVCWAVRPCTVLEPIRVASRGLAHP
jgi:hypothetical protein